jgi:hypothetical protein
MMLHDTQNYWGSGFCLSSGINERELDHHEILSSPWLLVKSIQLSSHSAIVTSGNPPLSSIIL